MEALTRNKPSTPFKIFPGQEAWVSVLEDVDHSPSVPFSGVATVYLIESGSEPDDREDVNGLPSPTIPRFCSMPRASGSWRPRSPTATRSGPGADPQSRSPPALPGSRSPAWLSTILARVRLGSVNGLRQTIQAPTSVGCEDSIRSPHRAATTAPTAAGLWRLAGGKPEPMRCDLERASRRLDGCVQSSEVVVVIGDIEFPNLPRSS